MPKPCPQCLTWDPDDVQGPASELIVSWRKGNLLAQPAPDLCPKHRKLVVELAETVFVKMKKKPVSKKQHVKDSDCAVDPATGCCTVCGVLHGPKCQGTVEGSRGEWAGICGQRAFHKKGCEWYNNS